MTDIDRIAEAEQGIVEMVTELSRMRDAADLLNASQAKVDAILNSAQTVAQTAKTFLEQCGPLVSRLSSTDLSQILDRLSTLQNDLNEVPKLLQTSTGLAMNEARKEGSKVTQELARGFEDLSQSLQGISTAVREESSQVVSQLSAITNKIEDSEARIVQFEANTKSSQLAFGVILVMIMLTNFATLGLIAFRMFFK